MTSSSYKKANKLWKSCREEVLYHHRYYPSHASGKATLLTYSRTVLASLPKADCLFVSSVVTITRVMVIASAETI